MSEFNVIVAGVGGQGILTIATLIAQTAIRKGWQVKQSEVHGMSQRGGAVQAHVRIADRAVHSELIPLAGADLIIAVEPLESLRYLEYLNPQRGAIVTSSAPMKNIHDYPPIERVLGDVARSARRHAVIDAPALARKAGSPKSENVAILGAASEYLPFAKNELLAVIRDTFAGKGENIVAINRRAFDLGIEAASAQSPPSDRDELFEHEVYELLTTAGHLTPPLYRFVPANALITPEIVSGFSGDRVMIKIVSPAAVHKSDRGGVRCVARSVDAIQSAAHEMIANDSASAGVLLVEFVEHPTTLGGELFVGVRASAEFGPLIVAGLGGVQTEYLASRIQPDRAVAIAPALETSAEEFFEIFARTVAFELISGHVRGSTAAVDRGQLLGCFQVFLDIATQYRQIAELEVNPFAVVGGRLIPLDGRGRISTAPRIARARAVEKVRRMIEPRTIAVMGVSAQRSNFGRIILNNTQAAGFPHDRLYVIKDGMDQIDGARCVPTIADVPKPLDVLVAAVNADQVPQLAADVLGEVDGIGAVILISGGLGETSETKAAAAQLRQSIEDARAATGNAPIFVGPNSMGIISRPGRIDTFFIPPHKLEPRRDRPVSRLALVSQSGAFIISRMSNLRSLDPSICVSLGNQLDVTFGDVIDAVGQRDDIDCIGVYVEGFSELDGLECFRAVKRATRAGKTVVFYKAGRTAAGRTAAQGHTASLAGDWDACCAAMRQSGALVATTFDDFERLVELATLLHGKTIDGTRIAAISNAGCETVAMADNCAILPDISKPVQARLREILAAHRIAALVNLRNPLDLTPMADDETYEQCADALLASEEFDAAIVACVPMSAQLLTTATEIDSPGSVANRLVTLARRSTKPIVAVFDCAVPYQPLIERVRNAGVPVFSHADEAICALAKYLAHRAHAARVAESVSNRRR